MAADTRLQLVAGDDVGALAALAFDDPAAFSEPTELAGDDLAMAEVAATFARVLGRPVQYVAMPHESAAQFDPGLATLGAPGWTARATGPTSVPSAGCDPGCSPWQMEPEKNVADDREREALTLSCLRARSRRGRNPELCALPSLYGSVRRPAGPIRRRRCWSERM